MRTDITRAQTPEERELNKKLHKLSKLESKLAHRELDLATFQAELNTLETRYIRTVGVCYTELDEIEALIAEAKARLKPKDKKVKEKAARARAQAQESSQATGITQKPREKKFQPSEKLKKLYREVAKRIHPDLSIDEKDRSRRQDLMAAANSAYEKGDEAKLGAIIIEWESSPESVKGAGIAVELVRVIRKIAQVEKRLRVIEMKISHMKESDLYQLKTKMELAENEGRDLLSEMASRVQKKIVWARDRLDQLTGERAHHDQRV